MKIKIFSLIAALAVLPFSAFSQNNPAPKGETAVDDSNSDAKARMAAEEAAFYADADTALYGVRYLFNYLANKEAGLRYKEDRVVLVAPEVTLDMSYEGIGEIRWRNANPDKKSGDPTLAYRLTPSYYFYYPETGRLVDTYRIFADEYKLSDRTIANDWKITADTCHIGEYACRKATLDRGGRRWTAWFTEDLPCQGAPRDFNGLPGVVLSLRDADGEVSWMFNGIVENLPDSRLYIKFPSQFVDCDPAKFPLIVKTVAMTDANNIQRSGVMDKSKSHFPEKYRPSTGIHAVNVDNPIDR